MKAILCRQWRKNKKFFWNLLNFEKCDYGVCCNEKWAVTVVQMFLYLSYLRHRIVWTSIWYFFFTIETKFYYQLCYGIHLDRLMLPFLKMKIKLTLTLFTSSFMFRINERNSTWGATAINIFIGSFGKSL